MAGYTIGGVGLLIIILALIWQYKKNKYILKHQEINAHIDLNNSDGQAIIISQASQPYDRN